MSGNDSLRPRLRLLPPLPAGIALAATLIAGPLACGRDSGSPSAVEPSLTGTPSLTRTVVLSGRSNPWDIAVTPSGLLFFTERCSGLSMRRPDGSITRLFGTAGSALVASDLFCQGQSGMLGVALDPAFATNRRVYVYMASNLTTNPRTNRVVRLVLTEDLSGVATRTDIITDIAYKDAANSVGGAGAHSGGRIRFGPDGFLYVGTGDNHNGTVPQSPTNLGGKVLRVTSDGAAAPGNAEPAGFDARIYTYGHRNVQGIAFHPTLQFPVIAEHGPNHSDEVTILQNGGNGGWDPKDRPALSCPSDYCGYAGNATTMPMTDAVRFNLPMPPLWTNNGASQGMGPAVFLSGREWRDWDGALAVGIMGGQRLVILRSGGAGFGIGATTAVNAALPNVRYRALTLGPDGALWIATDAGEIWRVEPSAP